MVLKYRFGDPFDTEAVVHTIECTEHTEIPVLKLEGTTFSCELQEDEIVYGLGENVRGINKRGWIYESNCSDDPNHQEDTHSLYGAHNFLILSGERHIGFFFDTPGKVVFDIGYTEYHRMQIQLDALDVDLYVIECEDDISVVREFRQMIGTSYIPPRWAFGFAQSRWSYMTADEVREVVRQYRENHLPLDSINLDIDYMERFKDFTINQETFPDFKSFAEEMKAEHIHLVPIIDAGVKIEDGYEVYEEGKANNYFCKGEDGEDFVAGVWPGKCHFPDMLNKEARKWFGRKYQNLLEQGVDGFWNDMNEPAIFYSEKRLNQVLEEINHYRSRNLDLNSFFEFRSLVGTLSNHPEDYRSFYHTINGQQIRHDKVHNLFGYNMTRAAGEAFDKLVPEKRVLLYSRASYIGMHRYGGIWTGDNKSWWSHLLMNLKMMPSLNMCGYLYTGADLGGFGADTTPDLMLRWMALGIFMPLLRNHSAMGTRRQELYRLGFLDAFRGILQLRYRLLPYLYSEFLKAAADNQLYASPLGFVWPEDAIARQTEDELMIGESILIAPVYEQNVKGRVVYLPEEMKLLRFVNAQVVEETVLGKGHHYVAMGLEEIVIFLRKDHILPLAQGGEYTEAVSYTDLEQYSFGEAAEYTLYVDDGETKVCKPEKILLKTSCK